jgi:hypothetical protein
MDTMWKQNAVWIGLGWKNFAETEKFVVGQFEHESHVDRFFYIKGIVHHEFLHQGKQVNHRYYLKVLKRLRENVRRKNLICGETTPCSS